jgi:hypothetical protein
MFGHNRGVTTVSSGKSNGRSFSVFVVDGKVTVSGVDNKGRKYKRIAIIKDGEVWDNKLVLDGETTHHIVYGQYEKCGNDIIQILGKI